MMWIPRVEYGPTAAKTVFAFSLPQRLWTPASLAVGGTDTSAAGVPESFVIRRDEFLDLRLAFWEREWVAVHAWLAWMQDTAQTCAFFPDRNGSQSFQVWLETPKVGEEIRPERGEYAGTYEIGVRLRRTAGGAFDVRAYE